EIRDPLSGGLLTAVFLRACLCTNSGKSGSRYGDEDPVRGLPQLEDQRNRYWFAREHWPTSYWLAQHETRERMDARSAHKIRSSECSPGALGTVRTRLVE